ncbi:MAG: septum formation initiator family protein [Defluviitaleaceae bacterium]|nr:septum formation initiator family protein [Defluviitaleaceae bacterium]
MKNEQPKKFKISNTMYHAFWALLLISAVLTANAHWERHNHQAQERVNMQQQLDRQILTNESLRQDILLYGSDAYIERTASERLGLVHPDEIVFISNED